MDCNSCCSVTYILRESAVLQITIAHSIGVGVSILGLAVVYLFFWIVDDGGENYNKYTVIYI